MSNPSQQIDPRGPRFTAGVTLVLFAAVLLTAPAAVAIVLLGLQTVFFAIGAGRGVQHTPTAVVFRKLIRPRLAPPAHFEDPEPPRFAQTVGLAFAVVALAAFGFGADTLGLIASAFAFTAAFLNAVFGYCLGCELYLIIRRFSPAKNTPSTPNNPITTNTNKEVVA